MAGRDKNGSEGSNRSVLSSDPGVQIRFDCHMMLRQ